MGSNMPADSLGSRPQIPAAAAQPAPRATTYSTPNDSAAVLRMLTGMFQKIPEKPDSRRPTGKSGRRQTFSEGVAAWGQQTAARIFGSGAAAEDPDSILFDPQQYESDPADSDAKDQEAIVAKSLALLPRLLKLDARAYNMHSPGMGDHVDNHPDHIIQMLQDVARALTFKASAAGLASRKPLLVKIYERVKYLQRNSKPPYVAARQTKDLDVRIGSRNPDEHPGTWPDRDP
jgi:hypothetical protein